MAKEYDPRMHSAEHALSGVLIRRYGCPRCFSTHINANKSKVDFRFPHDLSAEEAASIAAAAASVSSAAGSIRNSRRTARNQNAPHPSASASPERIAVMP